MHAAGVVLMSLIRWEFGGGMGCAERGRAGRAGVRRNGMARHRTTPHNTVRYRTARHDTHDTKRHDTAGHVMPRHEKTSHDTTRHDDTTGLCRGTVNGLGGDGIVTCSNIRFISSAITLCSSTRLRYGTPEMAGIAYAKRTQRPPLELNTPCSAWLPWGKSPELRKCTHFAS